MCQNAGQGPKANIKATEKELKKQVIKKGKPLTPTSCFSTESLIRWRKGLSYLYAGRMCKNWQVYMDISGERGERSSQILGITKKMTVSKKTA